MNSKDQQLLEQAYETIQEQQIDSWVKHITDFKDRQAYIGNIKMAERAYKESRRMKDFKQAAKIKLGDSYREKAAEILRKYVPDYGRQ